jgi:hypothetical protein
MNTIKEVYTVIEVITVIAAFVKLAWWAGIKLKNMFSLTIEEIKKKNKKTTLDKFLTQITDFIPSILSVLALSIDMYLNRPFDMINFILVSCFVTMTLWNIILVIVFNKIESLELNLANTASGLIRLTSDLRQAKTEFKTTSDELKKAAESVKDVKKDVEYVKSISSLNLFNNY